MTAMKISLVVTKDLGSLYSFSEQVQIFSSGRWKVEANRGMQEAGRKMLTKVRRTARDQMALKAGYYQSFVVANSRGWGEHASLSYHITGNRKGGDIKAYRGLRALSKGSRIARSANSGRGVSDQGFVRSSVWNVSRVFKRSFANNAGYFSLIPASGSGGYRSKTPKEFWTFGAKGQPRDAHGRFTGTRASFPFRLRRLYGPSLSKEIGDSNTVKRGPNHIHIMFERDAPVLMEQYVVKRVNRLMKW